MAANPVICLVVVGLGVPFATSGVRVNPMVGMTKAMVLFFAFFAMANVVSILGSQGRLPALWAAWLPTILAAALGLWLMRRARFS
jgi:lipopolysaccharide export LptBFGC system permease protein LptF